MQWYTSGAFALYGIVAGGALTSGTAVLTNRHVRRIASADQTFQAEEAERARVHEIDLDRRRLIRAARERTYPVMAEAVQESATRLSQAAGNAMAGTRPKLAGAVHDARTTSDLVGDVRIRF